MKRKTNLLLTLFVLLSAISLQSFTKDNTDPLSCKNVLVFDPTMDMNRIQSRIDSIFAGQSKAEFSKNRYAFMFRPGKYSLDIQIGYYMSVIGLGSSPEDVVITGAVRSNTTHGNSVLTNFWRSVENVTIIPSKDSTMVWGVSQAAPLRRIHLKGNLQLFDKGYASGGFLADSRIDGTISSGPQQQWLSRNSYMKKWVGANWNMMFIGVHGAPSILWPEKPYTVINETPILREKPYITFDGKQYFVNIPGLMKNSSGVSWDGKKENVRKLPIKSFYVVKEGADNSATINKALEEGKNLLFTPGIYHLDKSLLIRNKNTTVIGIGMPSLVPDNGNAAIEAADVDGITICGLTIDAGAKFSDQLFVMGEPGASMNHEKNPSFLFDIFFRVGGPAEGSARACMVINSSNLCIDHTWIWRADHGTGVGWTKNKAANGLIVNGNDVTIYGLFNEHFQEYQTLWNGENGRTYFYQSEMPYDPPTADSWKHDATNGYASYKVSDNVKNHEAWALGIYNVFYNAPVIVDNAIECPANLESKFHHMIIFWLNGNKESVVKSIINGKGGTINVANRKAVMD
jgi:hypothetical protein